MRNTQTLLKLAVVIGASFISLASQAEDFNDLINQNMNSQKELHQQMIKSVEVSQAQVHAPNNSIKTEQDSYIADVEPATINIKTKKAFLTHEKEKTASRASVEQNDKRLAQELKELE